MRLFRWFKDKIKAHDLYATPVSLMYKGEPDLKTPYGGFVSLMIKLLIVTSACFLIRVIFTKSDTTKSVNKIVYDLTNEDQKHYIGQSTFKIAIGLLSVEGIPLDSYILNKAYFSVATTMVHSQWIDDKLQQHFEPIESGKWEENDLPSIDQKTFRRNGFAHYLWLKRDDYYLKSDLNGDESTAIYITLNKWSNSTESNITCKTEEEIENLMKYAFVNIATISGYFDFDDYQEPIKTYMNDFDPVSLNSSYYQYYDFRIQQNKAIISDNLIATSSFEKKQFYSLGTPSYRIHTYPYNSNVEYKYILDYQEKASSMKE